MDAQAPKKWFHCPVCGQKLCQCTEKAQGVYIKCKRCKKEVEVNMTKKGA